MKKHFLSVVMAMFIITSATAQNLQFGISGGIDAARLALSGASGGPLKYKNDIAGGLSLEATISDNFGVQLEANFSRQGTAIVADDGSTAGSFNLDYITIPVLIKLYGTPRLNFFAGPQVGLLLSGKSKQQGVEDQDVKDQFKSTDFYAVFGSEYKFANGIFVNARYNLGLSNINDQDVDPQPDFKNRYFSFRIGYAFKL
jgi:hypothetical protein